MRSRIQKTVHEDGRTEMSLTHVPATPDEIIEYLRECACVDDRGIRRLPNWLDDEVFDSAANLIDRLKGDAHTILVIAKNALQNEARRSGPLTTGEIEETFKRLERLGLSPQETMETAVKDLEWNQCEALSLVGCYYINRIGGEWEVVIDARRVYSQVASGLADGHEAALAEAKAAAQADYERRILSALTLKPLPKPQAE